MSLEKGKERKGNEGKGKKRKGKYVWFHLVKIKIYFDLYISTN